MLSGKVCGRYGNEGRPRFSRVWRPKNIKYISQASTVSNSEQSGSVQIAGKGENYHLVRIVPIILTHLKAVEAAIAGFLAEETAADGCEAGC
ncbi:hypothetical protein BJX63DRAFT_386364 [Aspergillus granulosus]|uniref:Uncharacterized protein n=1 Tax=Aspergillus granulosus TaxID=176169 RepID=A0ABR4HNY5_9EURO